MTIHIVKNTFPHGSGGRYHHKQGLTAGGLGLPHIGPNQASGLAGGCDFLPKKVVVGMENESAQSEIDASCLCEPETDQNQFKAFCGHFAFNRIRNTTARRLHVSCLPQP